MKKVHAAAWLASLFLVACAAGEKGDTGDKGDRGERGHSCTVTDSGDGARIIACEDGTEVTITDGVDGEQGSKGDKGDSCTVTDNGDGTKTLSCEDGTEVVVRDGAKGADSACAGNSAPVFEGAVIENPYGLPVETGRALPVRVTVSDSDGDALSIDFAGVGATFEPTDDPAVFAFTPHMTGGPFLYTVSVSDGCRVVAGTFTVRKVSAAKTHFLAITRGNPALAYRVELPSGRSEFLGDLSIGGVRGLAVNPVDGKAYVHNHNSGDSATEGLYEVNMNNGNLRFIGNTGLWLPDMAFSPDGTLYAFDGNSTLVTIDLETAEATEVADTGYFEYIGIAFRGDDLFVKAYDSLFLLDKTTGEVLDEAELDFDSTFDNVLEYDPRSDRFLTADGNGGETLLYAIDPEGGEAELLATLPFDNLGAIALLNDTTPPQPVQNLTATAGSDTVRLNFDFPSISELEREVSAAYLTWSPNGPAKPIRVWPWELIDEAFGPVGPVGAADAGDGDGDDEGDDDVETVPGRWFATGLDPATTYTFSFRLIDHWNNLSDEVTTTVTTLPAPAQFAETMYGVEEDGLLYVVNPATGELTEVGDTELSRVSAFAINPLDGKAYLTSNDTGKLYEVDLGTAEVTEIGSTGLDNVRDIAFSPEGELIGWNRGSDLVSFDLETGEAEVILSEGGEWPTGLAWFGGAAHVKIRNMLARWAVGDSFTDEPEFIIEIIGDIDYHLGHSLAFSESGTAYSIQHSWDNGKTTLFRIDGGSWVATRVADFPKDVRLTSVDFAKPLTQ